MPALTFYGTGFYSEGKEEGVEGEWWEGEWWWWWCGGRTCSPAFPSPLSFYTLFLCSHLSHHLQGWEGKQWSMLLSLCFVDTFQQCWRSGDDWRPLPLLHSEVVLLINTRLWQTLLTFSLPQSLLVSWPGSGTSQWLKYSHS